MNDELLKKLQNIECEILSVFAQFCEQNHLKYYLIGGTLLGAARYQKFIPWDNDIDVAMPREDYNRFRTLWLESKNTELFLQSGETDPLFSRGILKLRKKGTQIIENICSKLELNSGIYIDIFPIDFLSEFNYNKINKRAFVIKTLLNLRGIRSGYNNGRYSNVKKAIKNFMFFIKPSFLDKLIEKLCTKENLKEHNYAILYLHNYSWQRQIHNADVFAEGQSCIFEGKEYIAPKRMDEFLTKVFGNDYMKEPDEDKRKQPHNYIKLVIDNVEYNLR